MNLSTRTIEILENFSKIDSCVVFKEGKLHVTSEDGTTYVVAEVDEDFDFDFAVLNIKSFLIPVKVLQCPVAISIEQDSMLLQLSSNDIVLPFKVAPSDIGNYKNKFDGVNYSIHFSLERSYLHQELIMDKVNPEYQVYITNSITICSTKLNKLMTCDYEVSVSFQGLIKFETKDVIYFTTL